MEAPPENKFFIYTNTTDDFAAADTLGCAQNITVNFSAEEVEAPLGETRGWKTFSSGEKDGKIDIAGLDTFSRDELFKWLDTGDARFIWITNEAPGGHTELKCLAAPKAQGNWCPENGVLRLDIIRTVFLHR